MACEISCSSVSHLVARSALTTRSRSAFSEMSSFTDGGSFFEMINLHWSLRLLLETRSGNSPHTKTGGGLEVRQYHRAHLSNPCIGIGSTDLGLRVYTSDT